MDWPWLINALCAVYFAWLMLYKSYTKGQLYLNGFVVAVNVAAVTIQLLY